MAARKRQQRDVELDYPRHQLVKKLRRLADCLEQGKPFRIQVAGVRVTVPKEAHANIEHEVGARDEELEFQLLWRV